MVLRGVHRAEADLGYGVAHDVTFEGGVIGRVLVVGNIVGCEEVGLVIAVLI